MLQDYLLTLIFFIWINLTLSRNVSEIVPEKVLKINKCSTSFITDETIFLPPNFISRHPEPSQPNESISISIELSVVIRLMPPSVDCKESLDLITLNTGNNFTTSASSQPTLDTNGYMKYNDTNFSPEEYCLQSKSQSAIQFHICTQRKICTPQSPCIRKCCEIDEVLDLSQFESQGRLVCQKVSKQLTWSPHLYKDPYTKVQTNVKINFLPHHPKSFCNDDVTLMSLRPFDSQEISPFRILMDGSVTEKMGRNTWNTVPSDQTCVDGAQNFPLDESSALSGPFSGDEKDTVVVDCRSFVFDERDQQNEKFTGVYVIALVIGIIFLILTILAHIVLWKKQTIRGWTLMGYVSFLTLEFGFLIMARLITVSGIACSAAAIGTHFTALATFSWLTSMNFDVFWSFRTMNPCTTRREQFKMFLWYTSFATAIPLCIVTLGLSLENIYGNDPFSEVIIPEYGKTRCGLGPSADFPYLFGPISFLLGCNLIFLTATFYYVCRHQKILLSNGIKTKILNDKIRFFGMLFLVAGITWIFDVISWATTPTNAPTPWYWMFFDFINIFQAIAIFLIFVCNRTTMHNLQKEIPFLSNLKLWFKPDIKIPTQHGNDIGSNHNRKLSITQIFSITENGKNHLELI